MLSRLAVTDILTHASHRYRTLSIQAEHAADASAKRDNDPANAIRNIDAHILPADEILNRFSTSLKVGLDSSSVARRVKLGKNNISSPPTHYWKKALNYVFGGFNFLMWIAFIVTIVCLSLPPSQSTLLSLQGFSYHMSRLDCPTPPCSTSESPYCWYVPTHYSSWHAYPSLVGRSYWSS